MARTRTELDRDEKVDQILEAAERRLREGGYGALSVVGLARELGIAQNAVYWYFPSKDHLFVAALERILRGIVARKPPRRRGVEGQILWFVDQLAEIEHLRAAMYEQARTSPVVAEFAATASATWRRMLTNVLADRMPEAGARRRGRRAARDDPGRALRRHGAGGEAARREPSPWSGWPGLAADREDRDLGDRAEAELRAPGCARRRRRG